MNQKHNYDFSRPNKLDRKAFFLVIATSLWTIARAVWPILLLLVVKQEMKSWYILAMIFAVILITFSVKLINYFYFTYEVVNNELIINKGWLNKSKTVVKLDKIHEVNLNQKFVHKLIGLYFIAIDTAGSASTEIAINGVDFNKALALKEILTNTEESFKSSERTVFQEELQQITQNKIIEESGEVIHVSLMSLIKIGVTRNYLQTFGLLLAFSFQIIDQIQDFFYKEGQHSVYEDIFTTPYQQYINLMGVLFAFGLILFVVIFNLLRTLIAFYNYQIIIKKKRLTVSYGLTDSHIISVPSNKVQMFQFQQNYFQKLMNLYEIKIKLVASEEENSKKKGLVIPGADYSELSKIFTVIFSKKINDFNMFYKPNKGVLVLKFFWLCIPALIALIIMYFTESLQFSWTIFFIFIIAYFLILIGYRNEKLVYENDFILLRKGIWDITSTYLQLNKIQNVSLEQSYFQQKKQIGSLNLHTASGVVTIYYYDFKLLQKIANELLYKIEKDKHSWM